MSQRNGRWQDAVSDILKRRGVTTLAYFHTDHFEPWRPIPDRPGGMETCIDDVCNYVAQTADVPFARKASLFYKANVNYLVSDDRELIRADPDDSLGFVPRSPRDLLIGRGILEPIVNSAHEIQVHIHHEYYTFNDTARDPVTYAYLQTPRGRAFDDARFELAVRLSLATFKEDGRIDLDRWFFIHGHWALNASDPHECAIVREIEILQRNGCAGDFTQPAGRIHVDSRIEVPYLVDPVAACKGYDSPAADPTEAAGAGAAARERFMIWASAITHRACSIDTFSPLVQRRVDTEGQAALEHARNGVVIDGALFVKTHCHSMHPMYFRPDGPTAPHLHEGVRRELGGLFDVAAAAGAEVRFISASEAYEQIIAAPRAAERDLSQVYGLHSEPSMAAMGLTVAFRNGAGDPVEAPPLRERMTDIPAPSLIDPGRKAARGEPEVAAYIVPLGEETLPADEARSRNEHALSDAAGSPDALMAADDVSSLNERASAVCLARLETLGAESSGLTGFYAVRARARQLLQLSEVLCAEFVRAKLPGAKGAYEIGCGLGLLSLLLAGRGMPAVGYERNGARLATGQAIADAHAGEAGEGARSLKLVKGVFPRVARREPGLDQSVALVTNLLGSASLEQQRDFVRGLAAFGAVLIDAQRFYERRMSEAQIDGLAAIFAAEGFETPRLAFELGSDGRFLLFIHPAPRERLGWKAPLRRLGLFKRTPLLGSV